MKMIPLCPLPLKQAKKVSRRLAPLVEKIAPAFPGAKKMLMQAESDLRPKEFLGIALFSSLFFFVLLTTLFAVMGVAFDSPQLTNASLLFGLFLGASVFGYQYMYPKLIIKKRVQEIERNLLYVLRSVTIQINSGVPLFNSMAVISEADYGELSKVFGFVVREINAGKSADSVLDEVGENNPSIHFRRALWQLSNSLKAGGDVSTTLKEVINTLSKEQLVEIRKYGSQLNPMSLLYMMLAVIIPSLGMTFLMIMSSFPSLGITEFVFFGFFGVLALFQFMFLGMIKAIRPNLVV